MARKSRGRQRLAMVRIENESNRLVTFSKRRNGVFKKASELATLCDVEVAIVVFSPGQRVFSFGHPNVEHIVNQFYSGRQQINLPPTSATAQFMEGQRKTRLEELNMQLTQVLEHLEMGRKRAVELDKLTQANRNKTLVDTPIEKLDPTQLLQLKASLELLKARVENQAHVKAQAHAMAQAHFAQAQAQAEHQRQQQLYLNPASPIPEPPQLQLAAVENNNNNSSSNVMNNAGSSANHLEYYHRMMNSGNNMMNNAGGGGGEHIGDGVATVANGNAVVNNGGYHHDQYRLI